MPIRVFCRSTGVDKKRRYHGRPAGSVATTPAALAWMDRALDVAIRCQRAGEAEQAKQLYIRILEQHPDHALAMRNLGIIASQSGDIPLALGLAERAVALRPERAEFHASFAIALGAAGFPEKAAAEYRVALRLDPNCVDALHNYGYALRLQGEFREAIACLERVLALRPDHSHARTELGNAYLFAGRLEEAATCFEQVIEERPSAFEAMSNLAVVRERQGNAAGAEELLRRAIQIAPGQHYVRVNLGDLLLTANRVGEAVRFLEESARQAPRVAELQIYLGNAYAKQGRLDESLGCYRQALALEPSFAGTHQMVLFALHYNPEPSPDAVLAEHRKWAARHADPLSGATRHTNQQDPERRIRVGYVSADFRQHPIAYFTAPVFASQDRAQIETVCYVAGKPDAWTERIRAHASEWREIAELGDAELAELIEHDRIDILVDLSGHTAGNRLLAFARKPAPVQVSWLGYSATTGMQAMDYLIADQIVAPLSEPAPFIEQPLRLPGCFLAYEIPGDAPGVAPLPSADRGFVTYGCFNALSKVGVHVVATWSQILRANPAARLIMKNSTFDDQASREFYAQQFEKFGIDRRRVDLEGASPHGELLAHYAQVDIALDPFPYNGATTTCEALAMGVPVVTLRGNRFISRVGSSVLDSAGLHELITENEADYIRKAVRLAEDIPALARMRATMRERLAASALFDTAGFTRSLEGAYRDIWRKWCSAQKRN
ncbi:MAG TPA: tetratricopeptide repeat protein [Bryobacteraceae bacterium]|nr:tetratricopeptide repeat protein [Bryobacteraceae bacterium]